MDKQLIDVEVAYAKPEQQVIIALQVEEQATAEQAITQSGILDRFPEIDMATAKVGIFSKACKLQQALSTGDRVEIYRPLLNDPKEARRKRATKEA